MNEEENKAIERLKDFKSISILYGNTFTMFLDQLEKYQEATNTVLNLITKLQKENEILKRAFDKQTADMSNNLLELQQKDKQIDLMAEVMFKSNKAQLLIEYGIENKEQIIKEFKKLIKEKGE